jgi:hypothetical protein
MNIIYKKKIYLGMAELKSFEREKFILTGKPLKIIYNDEYMMLTTSQLRKGKFINMQKSIINEGQTYAIYGWRWKPTGRIEEQISIDLTGLSAMAKTPGWKKLGEKLHSPLTNTAK